MAVARHYTNVAKLLCMQSLVGLLVTLLFAVFYGWQAAISPFSGAVIALLSNAYFAFKFLFSSGWNAQAIVKAFYAGEAGKLVMTTALLFIALQFPAVNFPTLLAGFAAVLSVQWFALLFWRG